MAIDPPPRASAIHASFAARGDARLVEEHLDERRVLGHVRVHALERDELVEARAGARARQVDGGHPARGDLRERLVATAHDRRKQREVASRASHR
ncbi:MAG TPA: hypothetical protein VIL20_13295 [Sandaracinaceae bacterium]